MNLNQRRNKMLLKRMEEQEKEPEDDTTKREELYRVIEKIKNMPKKQDEVQTETTNDNITKTGSQSETNETESTGSADSLDVPAINFKRYLGTTGVRFIQWDRPVTFKTKTNGTKRKPSDKPNKSLPRT